MLKAATRQTGRSIIHWFTFKSFLFLILDCYHEVTLSSYSAPNRRNNAIELIGKKLSLVVETIANILY